MACVGGVLVAPQLFSLFGFFGMQLLPGGARLHGFLCCEDEAWRLVLCPFYSYGAVGRQGDAGGAVLQ